MRPLPQGPSTPLASLSRPPASGSGSVPPASLGQGPAPTAASSTTMISASVAPDPRDVRLEQLTQAVHSTAAAMVMLQAQFGQQSLSPAQLVQHGTPSPAASSARAAPTMPATPTHALPTPTLLATPPMPTVRSAPTAPGPAAAGVRSAVQALKLNPKELKDSKLTAIKATVQAAFAAFAVTAGDMLEVVDAHIQHVLTKIQSMEKGGTYVAVVQKVCAYSTDETVVNHNALITNRALVAAAVTEILPTMAVQQALPLGLDNDQTSLLAVEVAASVLIQSDGHLQGIDTAGRDALVERLPQELRTVVWDIPGLSSALAALRRHMGDNVEVRHARQVQNLVAPRVIQIPGARAAPDGKRTGDMSISDVAQLTMAMMHSRLAFQDQPHISAFQLALQITQCGLPRPTAQSSGSFAMTGMTALRQTLKQLQRNPRADFSDLVAAFTALETTYGPTMLKERSAFQEAVLPTVEPVSSGSILLSGKAPAPRDQRQPGSGPGRGPRQPFVPQARKADMVSAVGAAIPRAAPPAPVPSTHRHDGRSNQDQRAFSTGSEQRRAPAQPERSGGGNWGSPRAPPAPVQPRRDAPMQPAVCFAFRDGQTCRRPNCPYAHELPHTGPPRRGEQQQHQPRFSDRSHAAQQQQPRTRFAGFAGSQTSSQPRSQGGVQGTVTTYQQIAAVIDQSPVAAAVAAERLADVQGSPYEADIVRDVTDKSVPASETTPAIRSMVLTATELSSVKINIDTCACDNCSGISGPKSGESNLLLSGISEQTVSPAWTVACTLVLSDPAGTADILTPIKRAHYVPSLGAQILVSGSWLSKRGITLETGAYDAPSFLLYPAHPLTGERPRIRCDYIDGVLQITDPRVQLRPGVHGTKIWYVGPAGNLPTTATALQASTPAVPVAEAPVPRLRSVFAALSASSEPTRSQLKRQRQRAARASQPPAPSSAPAPTPLAAPPNGSVAATGVPPASDALECVGCDHPLSMYEPHVTCTSGLLRAGELCCASLHSTCTPPAGSRYIGPDERFVCANCVSDFVTKAMEAQPTAAATASRMILTAFTEAHESVSDCVARPDGLDDLCGPACACADCARVSGLTVPAGHDLVVTAAAGLDPTLPTPAPTGSGAPHLSPADPAPMSPVPEPATQLGMGTIVDASAQPTVVAPAVASRRRTIAEVIASGEAGVSDDEPPGLVSTSSDSEEDRRRAIRRTGRVYMAFRPPARASSSVRTPMRSGSPPTRCEADCTCQACIRGTGRNVSARHDPLESAASRFVSELPAATPIASVLTTTPAMVLAPMLSVADTNLQRGVPTFAFKRDGTWKARCVLSGDLEDKVSRDCALSGAPAAGLDESDGDLPGLVDSSSDSDNDRWHGVRRGGDVYVAHRQHGSMHSPARPNQFARPVPQAPLQRQVLWEVRTIRHGMLNQDLWQEVDVIAHQLHCFDGPYGGLAKAMFDKLPYGVPRGAADTRGGSTVAFQPGTVDVQYPRGPDHDRYDGALPVIANLFGQIGGGRASDYLVAGYSDSRRSRLSYFGSALDAMVEATAAYGQRLRTLAIPYDIGCASAGGVLSEYEHVLGRFAAANSDLQIIRVRCNPEPADRTNVAGSPSRGRNDESTGASRRPQSRERPSASADRRSQEHSRASQSAASTASLPGSGHHIRLAASSPTEPRPATSAVQQPARLRAQHIDAQCRFVQRGEPCPYQHRPSGCKFRHTEPPATPISGPSSSARPTTPRSTSESRAQPPAPARADPLLELSINSLDDARVALGVSPGALADPRSVGIQFLQEYRPGRHLAAAASTRGRPGFVVLDWGARSFGAARAVLQCPYSFYIGCDLFAYDDPRVLTFLSQYNANSIRVAYMRGYMGSAPTTEAIETTMSEAFGLPLDALRVVLATPNCGTVSSAVTSARYPALARDPCHEFAPLSRRAAEDDRSRRAIIQTVISIRSVLRQQRAQQLGVNIQEVQPLLTCYIEQPRSGCAESLPDLRRMREFGDAVVNYSDHCKWAEQCQPKKPTCYHTLGRHHRFNTVCRQGDDCGFVRLDGRHIRSIVDYNDPTQDRVPDEAPERSQIPFCEIGFLVANALHAQDRHDQNERQRLAGLGTSHGVLSFVPQSQILTARLPGRATPIAQVVLDALQLHQATGHVSPALIHDSMARWLEFRFRTASGKILSGGDVRLSDLHLTGTCDSCELGRANAAPSRHTARQREALVGANHRRPERRPSSERRASSAPSSRSASPARSRQSARVQAMRAY